MWVGVLLKRTVIMVIISKFEAFTNILKFIYFGVLASFWTSSFFIKAFSNESNPPNHLPANEDRHFLFKFTVKKLKKSLNRFHTIDWWLRKIKILHIIMLEASCSWIWIFHLIFQVTGCQLVCTLANQPIWTKWKGVIWSAIIIISGHYSEMIASSHYDQFL